MNFAMMMDGCAQRSYFVKDKKAYKLKSDNLEPYVHYHSISNECGLGIWGWPFLFNGYMINLTEWDELPTLDLDVIMVALEKKLDMYNVDMLRRQYPNAMIVSFVKEDYWINCTIQQRVDFFKSCDVITFPWNIDRDRDPNGILGLENMTEMCGRDVHYIPQPHDINFLYDRYFEPNRNIQILNYRPTQDNRISSDGDYIEYIGNKYNVKVIKHLVKNKDPHKDNTWEQFLSGIKDSLYCFNTAKEKVGGSMGVQCAALGILNFGGIQDSHEILFSETATNDLVKLEDIFQKIHNDNELRESIIKKAFDKALENYSHDSVKKRFIDVIKGY